MPPNSLAGGKADSRLGDFERGFAAAPVQIDET